VLLLSAPNGVIRDEFQVSLPEPRWDPMNRLDDEFIRLREKIYVEMRQAVANTGDEK
jgi:NitT/TauT family transport system ATP-binding protein